MSVDELLDLIDETLEEGTGLPFTGGKRMVDVEKLQEMLPESLENESYRFLLQLTLEMEQTLAEIAKGKC